MKTVEKLLPSFKRKLTLFILHSKFHFGIHRKFQQNIFKEYIIIESVFVCAYAFFLNRLIKKKDSILNNLFQVLHLNDFVPFLFVAEGNINEVLIKTLAEAHANTNLKLEVVHEMFRKPQVSKFFVFHFSSYHVLHQLIIH